MFDHTPYHISPFADSLIKSAWRVGDRWRDRCLAARARIVELESHIEELEKKS